MKKLIAFLFLSGCAAHQVAEIPLDVPAITGLEVPTTELQFSQQKPANEIVEKPAGMPYEVFARSQYSYKLPYPKDICNYDPLICKGYVFAAGDDFCYCIPQKCMLDDSGKEVCKEVH